MRSLQKRASSRLSSRANTLAEHVREEKRKRELDLLLEAAEAAKRSLWQFLKQAWPIIEPSFALIDTWYLEDICYILEAVGRGEIDRLVINIPPGHAKSNTVSVAFPAWRWTYEPGWRVISASYEANLSKRDNLRMKDVVLSDWYKQAFTPGGEWWLTKEHEVHLMNSAGGFRLATSVGGKGTGWRSDTILIDDPLNALEARSDAARKRAIEWLDKAISSRLKDPRTGQIVLIMQRLHAEDPTGHVLQRGDYEHLCLPSRYEVKRHSKVYIKQKTAEGDYIVDSEGEPVKQLAWQDRRTQEGELLFPALYTERVLKKALLTMTAAGFAGQHQQRPGADEGNMFIKSHWGFWKPDGTAPDQVFTRPQGCSDAPAIPLPVMDQVLLSLDCSFKDKKTSDYVVLLVIGVAGARRFVLNCFRGQWSFTKTLKQLLAVSEMYPQALRKLVEDKANGTAVIDTLTADVPGLIPIEPKGGKESRAAAIQPYVEAGNVYLCDGAHWLDEFVQELADFPTGANDDQVDALSQALIYLSNSPYMTRALQMVNM